MGNKCGKFPDGLLSTLEILKAWKLEWTQNCIFGRYTIIPVCIHRTNRGGPVHQLSCQPMLHISLPVISNSWTQLDIAFLGTGKIPTWDINKLLLTSNKSISWTLSMKLKLKGTGELSLLNFSFLLSDSRRLTSVTWFMTLSWTWRHQSSNILLTPSP